MTADRRIAVRDARALRALAHPLRLRLLSYLLTMGPRTARQCAEALDDTGANCSYHLRHLAGFGLVERVAQPRDADQRERPWRATATGFDFGTDPTDPETGPMHGSLLSLRLDEHVRLFRSYLDHERELSAPWRRAAALSGYGLLLTADELADLTERLDAVIRPYISATRPEVPEHAALVHLSLQAFRHPGTG